MPSLPKNLDYRIIHGYTTTGTVTVRIFNTKVFERTGCEDSAEVFSVDIHNETGKVNVTVNEDEIPVDSFSIEDLSPQETNTDVKLSATTYHTLPPNCS